jgi:hypothetical protein
MRAVSPGTPQDSHHFPLYPWESRTLAPETAGILKFSPGAYIQKRLSYTDKEVCRGHMAQPFYFPPKQERSIFL